MSICRVYSIQGGNTTGIGFNAPNSATLGGPVGFPPVLFSEGQGMRENRERYLKGAWQILAVNKTDAILPQH